MYLRTMIWEAMRARVRGQDAVPRGPRAVVFLLVLLLGWHGVASAGESPRTEECERAGEGCRDPGNPSAGDAGDAFERDSDAYEIVVHGEQLPPGAVRVTRAALLAAPEFSLGDALARLPGVDVLRKAPNSLEPVVRGLSGERVQTRAGGVPLYGACPSRMDPPLGYLGLQDTDELVISSRIAVGDLGACGHWRRHPPHDGL